MSAWYQEPDPEPEYLPWRLPVGTDPVWARRHLYEPVASHDGKSIQWSLLPEFRGLKHPPLADPRSRLRSSSPPEQG